MKREVLPLALEDALRGVAQIKDSQVAVDAQQRMHLRLQELLFLLGGGKGLVVGLPAAIFAAADQLAFLLQRSLVVAGGPIHFCLRLVAAGLLTFEGRLRLCNVGLVDLVLLGGILTLQAGGADLLVLPVPPVQLSLQEVQIPGGALRRKLGAQQAAAGVPHGVEAQHLRLVVGTTDLLHRGLGGRGILLCLQLLLLLQLLLPALPVLIRQGRQVVALHREPGGHRGDVQALLPALLSAALHRGELGVQAALRGLALCP
mmetsp:Transcript_71224/g.170082  ORF Transcript_71224/g.170082 Transcript_71224/m.170082 type:complete len:259 (-) Transcript_71224:654-1430(-)